VEERIGKVTLSSRVSRVQSYVAERASGLPHGKAGQYICAHMNPSPSDPPYPLQVMRTPVRTDVAPGAPDDAQLLRQMAAGNEQALGAFYDKWHPLVHAVALRVLHSGDDVEDVVEETFWQAWRQAGRYESARGAVQTWILTIARSRALDRVRLTNRRREEPIEGESGEQVLQLATESDPSMDAESAERRKLIVAALANLPEEQRETIELGYFGGLSQSEIAAKTGHPLGTIKTRMRLAMQKLRGSLQVLREEART
jgi:RNA polymerase sigma-70 factor (ECF subfamily)